MADINELDLSPEELGGEVDYEAPEGGSFPPSVPVGVSEFIFKLAEENPFEGKTTRDQSTRYFQVNYEPLPILNGGEPAERPLKFQNVTSIKTGKMRNSTLAELLRSLNIRIQGPLTPQTIQQELQAADGQGVRFRAWVDHRAYNKGTDETISTSPNTKRGELPWPRDEEGQLKPEVTFSDGFTAYGRETINPFRFKLPQTQA